MPNSREIILRGGNTSGVVVQIGSTVRKVPCPASASVDSLLLHLEGVGFTGAPRALGYDERGRQILSYIEGHCSSSVSDLGVSDVRDIGRRIREFHDAVASFIPPANAAWQVAMPPDEPVLITHNDLGSWNLVRGAGTFSFIDWDGAGPGSRLWDISYAALSYAPMFRGSGFGIDETSRRLAALADGYGLSPAERHDLIPLLRRRAHAMYELLARGGAENIEPWSHLWKSGHGETWKGAELFATTHAARWANSLGVDVSEDTDDLSFREE